VESEPDDVLDPGKPMDDYLDPDGANPQAFDFSTLFASAPQSHPEGTGLSCQLNSFDSLFDRKGERRLLETGSSTTLHVDRYAHSFRSALILTKFWKYDRSPDYSELEIRSPHMKAAIKAVVPDYNTHDIIARHIVLRDEPRCLFHFRAELQAYGAVAENHQAAEHIFFMLQYAQNALMFPMLSFFTFMEDPTMVPSLDFLNLWMVFRPGDLVYIKSSSKKHAGHGRVYRFNKMERCKCEEAFCPRSKWSLTLEGIEYDGTSFGYKNVHATIDPYDGNRQIRDLIAFPLKYHPDENNLRQQLHARGAKLIQLHGHHYRQYSGLAELLGLWGGNDSMVSCPSPRIRAHGYSY